MKSNQIPTKKEVLAQVEAWDLIIHRFGRSWKDWPGISYSKSPGAIEAATAVERHFVALGYMVEHRTPGPLSNGVVRFLGRSPEDPK